jgi:hypothetical protein
MKDTLFDERRLVSRVLRHWQEMAIGRVLPSKDKLDPWLIGDDWSYCLLLSLGGAGEAPHFLTVGGRLLPAGTEGLEYRPLGDCPPGTILTAILAEVQRCVEAGRPVSIAGGAPHLGRDVLFRALLMPLSADGNTIDGIFGAANFRPVEAGENGRLGELEVQSVGA